MQGSRRRRRGHQRHPALLSEIQRLHEQAQQMWHAVVEAVAALRECVVSAISREALCTDA